MPIDPVDHRADAAVQDVMDGAVGDVEGGVERIGELFADRGPGSAIEFVAAGELAVHHRFRQSGPFGDRLHRHLGPGRAFLEQLDERRHDAFAPLVVVRLPTRLPAAPTGVDAGDEGTGTGRV